MFRLPSHGFRHMKLWLMKIKKATRYLIGFATLGLPLYFLVVQLRAIQSDYDEFLTFYPIHPVAVIFSKLLPYVTVAALLFYLNNHRNDIGNLKTFGGIFLVLTFLILSQLSLAYYILNYR